MNTSGVMSPPSIHVYDVNAMNGRRCSSNRTAGDSFSRSPGPMAVPNLRAQEQQVPPPLPPPRHIEGLAAGSDPGWKWGNTPNPGGFGGYSGNAFSSSSSFRGSCDSRMDDEEMEEPPGYSRRGSSEATIKPSSGVERKYDFSRNFDEGYHSLSGSSISNYRLHGERPLEKGNVQSASKAYDDKLLSKIGKPKTPPPALRTSSVGAASPASSLPFSQSGRQPQQLKSLSTSEGSGNPYPTSPFKGGPLSARSAESPRSRAISPSLLSSAASAKSFMDWRSPTWESGTPTSAVSDSYPHSQSQSRSQQSQSRFGSFSSQYQQQRQQRQQSRRGSVFSNYDESAAGSVGSLGSLGSSGGAGGTTGGSVPSEGASRGLKRGSQDQSNLAEPDTITDFPYLEETGAMQQLHLSDRAPLSLDPALQQYSSSPIIPSASGLGTKRRASSPPPDSSHDDKAPLHSAGTGTTTTTTTADLYHRNSQHQHPQQKQNPPNRASPVSRFRPQHGSVSSASSQGLRNGSYASSGARSVGSSLTSLSPKHGRLSPTSEYPIPQSHPERDSPYITSHPSPRSSLSHAHPPPTSGKQSPAAATRKMSADASSARKQSNTPNLQAPMHICQCCPKKPKKFNTPEELRAHECEKQYVCNFCPNRFKNKNEAERHQNSLHLRKNSWSCATLSGEFHRVFHPSTTTYQHASQPPTPSDMVAAVDICGYCGQEFANEPQPDWNDRVSHLTSVHKFGECNQSKKFFRADHFRQHLKHSHAGTSGKWTNMLEQECMKEEAVPDVMPQPVSLRQQYPQAMRNQPMQQAMHPMQGMPPESSIHPGLGGAPIANMAMMQGPLPGQPMNMMEPSGLREEIIHEIKDEM